MSETIGSFTVDDAFGILKPAVGIVEYPPATFNYTQAVPVESIITTERHFDTAADALEEAEDYREIVGEVVVFRGINVFVADCVPGHRAAKTSLTGGGIATAKWTLLATFVWVP